MKIIIGILYFATILLVGSLFVFALYAQIRMIQNRKEVSLFDKRILFNPFNIQFFGERYLSDVGLEWRNKAWRSIALVIALISVIFLFVLFFLVFKDVVV